MTGGTCPAYAAATNDRPPDFDTAASRTDRLSRRQR